MSILVIKVDREAAVKEKQARLREASRLANGQMGKMHDLILEHLLELMTRLDKVEKRQCKCRVE